MRRVCEGEPSPPSRVNHTGNGPRYPVPWGVARDVARGVARVFGTRGDDDTTSLQATVFQEECAERSSGFQDLWTDE